ncbi:hypothetical protein GJ744_003183 [Endocarpon pusillum]|uniref:Uncharacterized protein n=1 Tax=Endocarpon pusillum TaxID=364733 RepID=A0A8H7AMI4_9EURO|nr:hypothetical protein GJ744_003183 [Endocarpon pusillum]
MASESSLLVDNLLRKQQKQLGVHGSNQPSEAVGAVKVNSNAAAASTNGVSEDEQKSNDESVSEEDVEIRVRNSEASGTDSESSLSEIEEFQASGSNEDEDEDDSERSSDSQNNCIFGEQGEEDDPSEYFELCSNSSIPGDGPSDDPDLPIERLLKRDSLVARDRLSDDSDFDDGESVFSSASYASSVSDYSGLQHGSITRQMIAFLFEQKGFSSLVEEAAQVESIGEVKFERKLRRLLKDYSFTLAARATTHNQKEAAKVVR